MASVPITAPRHGAIARSAPKALPIRSGEDARAPIQSSRQDRALGVACLVACPAISGLFLGLVALVYAYPSDDGHAVVLGSLVGAITFAANALAIRLTASTVHGRAVRRARRAARHALQVARLTPPAARFSFPQRQRHVIGPRQLEEVDPTDASVASIDSWSSNPISRKKLRTYGSARGITHVTAAGPLLPDRDHPDS